MLKSYYSMFLWCVIAELGIPRFQAPQHVTVAADVATSHEHVADEVQQYEHRHGKLPAGPLERDVG